MRRFSILGLMGLVLTLAVGIAALRNADAAWAGGMMMVTLLLLGIALLAVIYRRGAARAGWLGFLVFGGAYFVFTQIPGLDRNIGDKLPTSRSLFFVHQHVAAPQLTLGTFTVTSTTTSSRPTPGSGETVVVQSATPNQVAAGVGATKYGGIFAGTILTETNVDARDVTNRWRSMLPGAANYEDFMGVGHCLFALLIGLLGAFIARRFERSIGPICAESSQKRSPS